MKERKFCLSTLIELFIISSIISNSLIGSDARGFSRPYHSLQLSASRSDPTRPLSCNTISNVASASPNTINLSGAERIL